MRGHVAGDTLTLYLSRLEQPQTWTALAVCASFRRVDGVVRHASSRRGQTSAAGETATRTTRARGLRAPCVPFMWSPASGLHHVAHAAHAAAHGRGWCFSGASATIASVVRMFLAIDAAFCSAERVTMAGSMIPALTMSTISPVSTSRPKPVFAARTSLTTTATTGDTPRSLRQPYGAGLRRAAEQSNAPLGDRRVGHSKAEAAKRRQPARRPPLTKALAAVWGEDGDRPRQRQRCRRLRLAVRDSSHSMSKALASSIRWRSIRTPLARSQSRVGLGFVMRLAGPDANFDTVPLRTERGSVREQSGSAYSIQTRSRRAWHCRLTEVRVGSGVDRWLPGRSGHLAVRCLYTLTRARRCSARRSTVHHCRAGSIAAFAASV